MRYSALIMNDLTLKNLKQLWWLRNIALAGQSAAIIIAITFLKMPLQEKPLWLIIGGMALINGLTYLRLKNATPVREGEFFCQLLLDMSGLFGLLYFTGGSSNPFTSLFILQVMIAATTLSPRYTWLAASITIALYTILMFWNENVPSMHHPHIGDAFNMHIHGMLVSFILLALLVAWFVVRMNITIRKQTQLLAEAEQITALGLLATSSAHELGTPLAIMAVLAGEYPDNDAKLMKEQIGRCKKIISQITLTAGVMRAESGSGMLLSEFLQKIADHWQELHPATMLQYTAMPSSSPVHMIAEHGLSQAIINLLNNAADSSPESILMEAKWSTKELQLKISDHGRGFSTDIINHVGLPGTTTKPEGLGLGLYLTKTIITRLGGSLHLQNRLEGGALAIITLPLAKLLL